MKRHASASTLYSFLVILFLVPSWPGVQKWLTPLTTTSTVTRVEKKAEINPYRVNPELNRITSQKAMGLSLQELVEMGLSHLERAPLLYDEQYLIDLLLSRGIATPREFVDKKSEASERIREWRKEVLTVFGLLQQGDESPIKNTQAIKRMATNVFTDSVKRDRAYKLALPSVKIAFGRISPTNRQDYRAMFKHASAYLATFNLEKENEYLRESVYCLSAAWEKKYYPLVPEMKVVGQKVCSHVFTERDRYGNGYPYRKIETFLYRRAAEGWDVRTMKRMVDQLLKDLS